MKFNQSRKRLELKWMLMIGMQEDDDDDANENKDDDGGRCCLD